MAGRLFPLLFAFFAVCRSLPLSAAEPVVLRIDSLLVTPSHTPSAVVHVKNLTASVYEGTVRLKVPARMVVEDRGAGGVAGARRDGAAIVYDPARHNGRGKLLPLEAVATGEGATVRRQQNIVAAAAPYFKPSIDGDPGDWADAISVSWTTGGRATQGRNLLESQAIRPSDRRRGGSAGSGDVADRQRRLRRGPTRHLAAGSPNRPVRRRRNVEVRIPSRAHGAGVRRCYLLATPGLKCGETQSARPLEPLVYADAEIAVRREKTTTYYECRVSLEADAGRHSSR